MKDIVSRPILQFNQHASISRSAQRRSTKIPSLPDLITIMRTVVLYGNSLVVSSIGASLQSHADLQVVSIDAALPDAAQRLGAFRSDVVIFDLATAQPEFPIELWKAKPQLLLIGVDLTTGQALVLSGQPSRLLTVDDLVHVIES
jgi:hypothetical protein